MFALNTDASEKLPLWYCVPFSLFRVVLLWHKMIRDY
jgi:hypothetical protein